MKSNIIILFSEIHINPSLGTSSLSSFNSSLPYKLPEHTRRSESNSCPLRRTSSTIHVSPRTPSVSGQVGPALTQTDQTHVGTPLGNQALAIHGNASSSPSPSVPARFSSAFCPRHHPWNCGESTGKRKPPTYHSARPWPLLERIIYPPIARHPQVLWLRISFNSKSRNNATIIIILLHLETWLPHL